MLEGHWQSPGLGIGVGFWDQIDDVDLLVAFAEAKVCHPSNIALEGKTDQFRCGAAQRNYLDSFFGTYSAVFLGFC